MTREHVVEFEGGERGAGGRVLSCPRRREGYHSPLPRAGVPGYGERIKEKKSKKGKASMSPAWEGKVVSPRRKGGQNRKPPKNQKGQGRRNAMAGRGNAASKRKRP